MSRYQGERIGEVKWSELFNKETGRLNNINFWKNLQKLDLPEIGEFSIINYL